MQSDKYKYGQKVLFLGILIDSTTMTVRIDAVGNETRSLGNRHRVTILILLINSINKDTSILHIDHTCIDKSSGMIILLTYMIVRHYYYHM
jgi:hypothetical protein